MASGVASSIALGLVLFTQVSVAESPNAAARIFRCEVNGKVAFTDQPCAVSVDGAMAGIEIVLPPINSADTPVHSARNTSRTAAADTQAAKQFGKQFDKQSESIALAQRQQKQRCERLVDQLDVIQSKMRSGYSGKQGEQLRERQRQLKQRYHTERCR